MKFSLKLLLWTMIVMAAAFGFSGFYFVNYVFERALDREAGQALDESSILKFAFETAALNVPAKYDVLQEDTTRQIASNLEAGGQDTGRMLRISDDQKQDKRLYLETMRDVTEVFHDRATGFVVYRRVTVVILLLGTVLMHFISSWLTRPIRLLTRATKRMAAGDYDYRARLVSDDELGQLTADFNRMANALKTPLTAIIGYADMLRSHRLDEEKSFMCANYIYTEGRRLETMSLRLLDIIVTKRQEIELQMVSAESLFFYLYDMYAAKKNMDFHFTYDEGMIRCDASLIKSVLINLLDNACKASEPGSRIDVDGYAVSEGYRFSVKDHGVGIPEEEVYKITKAFYMVDKSRSRSRNGAGLGLALCEEILLLHHSRLEIESEPGKGSCFSFVLPWEDGAPAAWRSDGEGGGEV